MPINPRSLSVALGTVSGRVRRRLHEPRDFTGEVSGKRKEFSEAASGWDSALRVERRALPTGAATRTPKGAKAPGPGALGGLAAAALPWSPGLPGPRLVPSGSRRTAL